MRGRYFYGWVIVAVTAAVILANRWFIRDRPRTTLAASGATA